MKLTKISNVFYLKISVSVTEFYKFFLLFVFLILAFESNVTCVFLRTYNIRIIQIICGFIKMYKCQCHKIRIIRGL